MLGAAGIIAPELLGNIGVIPAETGVVWFQSGNGNLECFLKRCALRNDFLVWIAVVGLVHE